MKHVQIAPTFDAWRQTARTLLLDHVPPEEVMWIERDQTTGSLLDFGSADPVGQGGVARAAVAAGLEARDAGGPEGPAYLPADPGSPQGLPHPSAATIAVPKRFVALAERTARHTDRSRWALLYRLLWRLVHEDRHLLDSATDPDVRRVLEMEREADQMGVSKAPDSPASAAAFLPDDRTLPALRDAAAKCTACSLHQRATQTVFGDGPERARIMFIGEQPGDQEDLQGKPFVGPAGEVLARALAEAGIRREEVYITNAVKHFKWEPRGKRRIHQTPHQAEIQACRPWLEAEIALLKPALIVCLGATAAQALMGSDFRILRNRGRFFRTRWAPWLMATIHPSAILRVDPTEQERAFQDLVADLRKAALQLEEVRAAPEVGG